jgi:tetratricopeptide (TPR) repeat protein
MGCTISAASTVAFLRHSRIAAALVLIVSAVPAAAQTGSASFAAATQAFEAGDHRRALELFEQLRVAGAGSPALDYNVAVCRYKLGDYVAAEAAFAALAASAPEFSDIAEYNIGLALLAQQRDSEARRAFDAARASTDPDVALLAERALASLGASTRPPAPRLRWVGSADVATGYDDNVALADDASLPATETGGSAFTELYGFASRRFDTLWPSRMELTGFAIRYPEAAAFDQRTARVGYQVRRDFGAWRFDAGPHLSYTTLGGDGFERQAGISLQAAYGISDAAALDLRWSYDDVADAAPQFSYIDGSRATLRLTFDRRGANARFRVSYGLERNDRLGSTVSADRSRVTLRVTRPLWSDWELDAWGSYRASTHERLSVPADERLVEWSVTGNRALAAEWLLEVGYYGADNDSDLAEFAYDRNRMMVGLSKLF